MTTARQRQPKQGGHEAGRLVARPGRPTAPPSLGLQPLGIESGRDALLYVPAGYHAAQPTPLVLMLHGAGGNAHHGLAPFLDLADEAGWILLAPDSRKQTWDIIVRQQYGLDIAFIDEALGQVFSRYAVDPARIAVEGFSDGASYALSVGLINGDLFTHIIAFSPGFMAPLSQTGEPRIYISHGIHDSVLPIDRCSRRLVPQLQRARYDVHYHEFDGPHTVPPEIVAEARVWFSGGNIEHQ
jgi:phospholipase/carboxylesterase